MVQLYEGTEDQFYMDDFLYANVNRAKKAVKDDFDMVFLIDGMEGGGKSVMAQQLAKACDPTICIERVVFSPTEFKKAVLSAEKFQAIIYDEAYTGLSSRNTMSGVNKALVKMMAEIRQKNLFIFVVMPTFFDLDKYVAIWRSRALIHIYLDDNFNRGQFVFFNIDRKKQLYVLGKKYYSYTKPRGNFIGKFMNKYTIDVEEYKKKKLLALNDDPNEDPDFDRRFKDRLEDIVFTRGSSLMVKQQAELLDVHRKTIPAIRKRVLERLELNTLKNDQIAPPVGGSKPLGFTLVQSTELEDDDEEQ